MKKRIVTLLMAITMVGGVLTGCGGEKDIITEDSTGAEVTESVMETEEIDDIMPTSTEIIFENDTMEFSLDELITVENEDRKAAYISALEKIVYQQASPDDTANENWFYGDNKFAIYDVNLDGKEELLIEHDSGTESDSKLFIYGYNDATKKFQKIFGEYPAITFYDNGMIKAEAAHNQTENEFWPYALYHMDEETGAYIGFVCVSSAEEEAKVYEKYLAGVEIIEIPFADLPIVRPEAAG